MMRVKLTHKQIEQLRPYFDRVQATAAIGYPGMLVAQIWLDAARGEYVMEPAFIDHDLAKTLTERGRAEIPGNTHLEKRQNQDASLEKYPWLTDEDALA